MRGISRVRGRGRRDEGDERDEGDKRQQFFEEAKSYTGFVSFEVDGQVMLLSTADEGAGPGLFRNRGGSEFTVFKRVQERVELRGVFVDVGANIGTTTLPALRCFDRAVAIEAEPLNAAILRANLALNGLGERAVVLEAAVSSEDGTAELRLSAKQGGHSLASPKPGYESMTVRSARLDSLLGEAGVAPGEIGLVWIDVNGYEAEVLRGAASVIAAGVPIVSSVRRRGVIEVAELLAARYPHVIDLRDERELGIGELPGYVTEAAEDGGRTFSDFLFLAERGP